MDFKADVEKMQGQKEIFDYAKQMSTTNLKEIVNTMDAYKTKVAGLTMRDDFILSVLKAELEITRTQKVVG